MSWARRKLFDVAARVLTKPRAKYDLLLPVDLEALRRTLRKGDVILVDGEQRVSQVIKYLTQSTWSHAVLYIGDELVRRKPARHAALLERHAADAEHLIVEALMEEGVTASPLAKYERYNLRVCRPIGLRRDDLARILDEVLGQLGHRYDVQNVVDLARYFFPVSLIPRRLRRRALGFGSGLPTEVICSSMIARAFQNVGFPILPALTPDPEPRPRRRWAELLGRMAPYPAIFHRQVETLITPRDFDLSPYFEVVKIAPVERAKFDYRRIRWA
ncbi:MAG TPA: YiiX/YebB-like N1pC/P60 family cysteine hydrolase [Candidatus Binatia bacterium]|nr:YiiX/YebB-like N1pC/P60 family cysteine hydrolase [Candidatus Binatia bacterium]